MYCKLSKCKSLWITEFKMTDYRWNGRPVINFSDMIITGGGACNNRSQQVWGLVTESWRRTNSWRIYRKLGLLFGPYSLWSWKFWILWMTNDQHPACTKTTGQNSWWAARDGLNSPPDRRRRADNWQILIWKHKWIGSVPKWVYILLLTDRGELITGRFGFEGTSEQGPCLSVRE